MVAVVVVVKGGKRGVGSACASFQIARYLLRSVENLVVMGGNASYLVKKIFVERGGGGGGGAGGYLL